MKTEVDEGWVEEGDIVSFSDGTFYTPVSSSVARPGW